MPRLILRLAVLAALLALPACQTALPGSTAGNDAPTANAITGPAIEVTPLDGAAAGASSTVDSALTPDPAAAAQGAVAAEAEAPLPPPAEVKPASQIACEKKGGRWAELGSATIRTCIKPTRDAGKACKRESQCESQCLARSGTCAPFSPLLGCNEVLQDNGARVTLCVD